MAAAADGQLVRAVYTKGRCPRTTNGSNDCIDVAGDKPKKMNNDQLIDWVRSDSSGVEGCALPTSGMLTFGYDIEGSECVVNLKARKDLAEMLGWTQLPPLHNVQDGTALVDWVKEMEGVRKQEEEAAAQRARENVQPKLGFAARLGLAVEEESRREGANQNLNSNIGF